MKTVLIFGASGYLGLFYTKRLLNTQKFNVKIDFSDLTQKKNFDLAGIDAVLYLAVIHQVDKANPNLQEINTAIPVLLARECKKKNIHFIYMSTEQVFNSKEKYVYKENDRQNAQTIYGASKAATERVISVLDNVSIIRTSMIYGYKHPRRKNLFTLVNMGKIDPYEIYQDAYTKPTLVDELCDCLDYIIENRLNGIFHAVGNEIIDRVSLLKKYFSQKYVPLTIDYMIKPINTPKNSDIQKYINIETSRPLKKFFKKTLDEGLKLEMNRKYE